MTTSPAIEWGYKNGMGKVWVVIGIDEDGLIKDCQVRSDYNEAHVLFDEMKVVYGGRNACIASRVVDCNEALRAAQVSALSGYQLTPDVTLMVERDSDGGCPYLVFKYAGRHFITHHLDADAATKVEVALKELVLAARCRVEQAKLRRVRCKKCGKTREVAPQTFICRYCFGMNGEVED